MRQFKFIYLLLIPLVYGLYVLTQNTGGESAYFYGFAENKETELSHTEDVLIKEILVTPGQTVKEGDVIMLVERNDIELQKITGQLDIDKIQVEQAIERENILQELQLLETSFSTSQAKYDDEIRQLQEKIKSKQSVFKGLKHVNESRVKTIGEEERAEIAALLNQKELERKEHIIRKQNLEAKKSQIGKSEYLSQKKVNAELEKLDEEEKSLSIKAPSDGIIGNIQVRVGENISSFNTLVSFYDKNPTAVKGFVHESMILEVSVGDSLQVSSINQPNHIIEGHVLGLGTRIVEIPERLRKIPDFKTYGREVLISISPNNPLLQKEKVLLNIGAVQRSDEASIAGYKSAKREKKITKQIKNMQ